MEKETHEKNECTQYARALKTIRNMESVFSEAQSSS